MDSEQQQDPQDFTFQIVEDQSTMNLLQIQTSRQNSLAEEQANTPALPPPSGPQILSDNIGLDKDLSLNQALNDAKQYESFMHELKQVHRKESEQERGQARQDSEEEPQSDVEEDLDSAPKNKAVHYLVQ